MTFSYRPSFNLNRPLSSTSLKQTNPTRESLQALKRAPLQKLCMSLFIKGANRKSVEIIENILSHYAQNNKEARGAKKADWFEKPEKEEIAKHANFIKRTSQGGSNERVFNESEINARRSEASASRLELMDSPIVKQSNARSVAGDDLENSNPPLALHSTRRLAHDEEVESAKNQQLEDVEKRTVFIKSMDYPKKTPTFEVYRDLPTTEQASLVQRLPLEEASATLLSERHPAVENVPTIVRPPIIVGLEKTSKKTVTTHSTREANMLAKSQSKAVSQAMITNSIPSPYIDIAFLKQVSKNQLLLSQIWGKTKEGDLHRRSSASLDTLRKRKRPDETKFQIQKVPKHVSSPVSTELDESKRLPVTILGKRAREPTLSVSDYEFADGFNYPLPPVLRLVTPPIMNPHQDPWPSVGPLLPEPPKKSPSFSKKPKRPLVFEGCALTYIGMMKPGFVPSLEQVESRKASKCWVAIESGVQGKPCVWVQQARPPLVQSKKEAERDERRRLKAICRRPKSVFSTIHVKFVESCYQGLKFNNRLEVVGYHHGYPRLSSYQHRSSNSMYQDDLSESQLNLRPRSSLFHAALNMRALSSSSSSFLPSSSVWLSRLPASNHTTQLFVPNSHDPKNFPKSITYYLGDIVVTRNPCKQPVWGGRTLRGP